MPQNRVIERNSAVRYTDEVIEGNTVRVGSTVPQIQERELRRTQIEAVRERSLSMNLRYVLFLTVAAVAVVTICMFFLKLQATSTQLQKKTVKIKNCPDSLRHLQVLWW